MELNTLLLLIILLMLLIISFLITRRKDHNEWQFLLKKMIELKTRIAQIEFNQKEDFKNNRDKGSNIAKANRDEISRIIGNFRHTFHKNVRSFNDLQRKKEF